MDLEKLVLELWDTPSDEEKGVKIGELIAECDNRLAFRGGERTSERCDSLHELFRDDNIEAILSVLADSRRGMHVVAELLLMKGEYGHDVFETKTWTRPFVEASLQLLLRLCREGKILENEARSFFCYVVEKAGMVNINQLGAATAELELVIWHLKEFVPEAEEYITVHG